ncbi:hypothetical protein JW859_04045 [bacterium]|nr:hypothetical protein [bacterium]
MWATQGQQLFSGGLVSAVCFGIGLIALLWVFRRTIIIRRRQMRDDRVNAKRSSDEAHQLIKEIDARDWKAKYDRSIKLPRCSKPDAAQRQLLQVITTHQRRREDD